MLRLANVAGLATVAACEFEVVAGTESRRSRARLDHPEQGESWGASVNRGCAPEVGLTPVLIDGSNMGQHRCLPRCPRAETGVGTRSFGQNATRELDVVSR